MLVGQIMSQKIVTISPDKRVGQALKLMQKHQIRHLPVMEHDRMVGWITSRDLREVLLASMLEEIKVGDVMVQAPLSVTPDTEVEEAARLIHEHKIGGMPVMEGDKLVGVITMLDLISRLHHHAGPAQELLPPGPAPGEPVRGPGRGHPPHQRGGGQDHQRGPGAHPGR